ncbi:MAG: DUF3198 domain-containing protein [Thermoplasmata archaeon]|jgi:hypothetical protein
MAGRPPLTFGRRFRLGMRKYRYAIAIVIFAVGILLTALAIGDFTPISSVQPFPTINSFTDHSNNGSGVNYNLAFVVAGPIIIIVGAYMVGAYFVARRRFEHLMETKSKAEFLRNLPEVEDLLWDLTPEDEIRYEDKKAELRIRR